jgi:hypothetical protein
MSVHRTRQSVENEYMINTEEQASCMNILDDFYYKATKQIKNGMEKEAIDREMHSTIEQSSFSKKHLHLKEYLQKIVFEDECSSMLLLNKYEMTHLVSPACTDSLLEYITTKAINNLYEGLESKNYYVYYFDKMTVESIKWLKISDLAKEKLISYKDAIDYKFRYHYIHKSEQDRKSRYFLQISGIDERIGAFNYEDIDAEEFTGISKQDLITGTIMINKIFKNMIDQSCRGIDDEHIGPYLSNIYSCFHIIKELITKEVLHNDSGSINEELPFKILQEYENLYPLYLELCKLEQKLKREVSVLAEITSKLEQQYVCFLDCDKAEKSGNQGPLYVFEDDKHGTKLKAQVEKFSSCEIFAIAVYQGLKCIFGHAIVPIEYKKNGICSIKECVEMCKCKIGNTQKRINNVKLIFNFFVKEHYCIKHKISLN